MIEQGDYSYASITEQIPEVMLDQTKESDGEGYSFWLPIDSTVNDNQIFQLEKIFKHKLLDSFKYFLRQKHFIELNLGQNPRFFSVLPNLILETYKKIIDNFYWTLLNRNYFPFAHYGDWGVLCFNANIPLPTFDYEIVILDHDDEYQNKQVYAPNFLTMFYNLDRELDQTIQQVRNHKKNNA